MSFGQFAATSQFYLYGRSNCTKTGWEKNVKKYPKNDILNDEQLDLTEKVYLITGANAGIGKEISLFLASKGATVYMICRNLQRAEAARNSIVEKGKNEKVYLLIGDCGLEEDVRKIWQNFTEHRINSTGSESLKIDALICNAGALQNTKTFTTEGVEVSSCIYFKIELISKI